MYGNFPRKLPEISAKAYSFHSNSLIFLRAALKQVIFLNIMHKVKAQRSGELFVKNMLILQHHFAVLDLEAVDLHR